MSNPKLKALEILISHLDRMAGKGGKGMEMNEPNDSPQEEGSESSMEQEMEACEPSMEGEMQPKRFQPKSDKQSPMQHMMGEEMPVAEEADMGAPKVGIEEILRSMGRTATPASKKGSIEVGIVKSAPGKGSVMQQIAANIKKKR